jgi:hypothetical protein
LNAKIVNGLKQSKVQWVLGGLSIVNNTHSESVEFTVRVTWSQIQGNRLKAGGVLHNEVRDIPRVTPRRGHQRSHILHSQVVESIGHRPMSPIHVCHFS